MEKMDSAYYTVDDIMKLCFVGKTKAYQIIKDLNAELADKGFFVPRAGIVPKKYVDQKLYIMRQQL